MQGPPHVAAVPPPTEGARPLARPLFLRLMAAVLLLPVLCAAGAAPAAHDANALDAGDLAILRAHGNTMAGPVIRNSCDAVVRPRVAVVTPALVVVTEIDPTGACSGSSPPGSLSVLVRHDGAWRLATSTTGSGFVLGAANGGHPDIVVQYPPFRRDCPVLRWDGHDYRFAHACSGGRG